MFSLIITILALVLVGLLAAGTIYYLGDNSRYAEDTRAQAFITETEQITAALVLYQQDKGGYPVTSQGMSAVDILVDSKYLGHIPGRTAGGSANGYEFSNGILRLASPEVFSENTCFKMNEIAGVRDSEGAVYVPQCTDAAALSGKTVCCDNQVN